MSDYKIREVSWGVLGLAAILAMHRFILKHMSRIYTAIGIWEEQRLMLVNVDEDAMGMHSHAQMFGVHCVQGPLTEGALGHGRPKFRSFSYFLPLPMNSVNSKGETNIPNTADVYWVFLNFYIKFTGEPDLRQNAWSIAL